jgi:hypothetical protein
MYQNMSIEPMHESGTDALRFVIGNSSALLDAGEIDSLITHLGQIRARMQPAPPLQPVESQSYTLEVDPCWHVDRSPLLDGVVLLLRHAGFGWTAFALSPTSISKLHNALKAEPPLRLAMSSLAN